MNAAFIRQLLPAILIAVLAVQPLCGQQGPSAKPVTSPSAPTRKSKLKRGTEIKFVLLDSVSSADAVEGQRVRFAVAEDVLADGAVVIPRGTPATGVVSHVRKGIPGKQNGEVNLAPHTILLADGSRIQAGEYPPGEDACGDMGPCWALIGFAIAVSPILITVGLIRLPERLAEDKKFKQQPGFPQPAIAGKDETLNPCSHSTAYTLNGFKFPAGHIVAVSTEIAANRALLDSCSFGKPTEPETSMLRPEDAKLNPVLNGPVSTPSVPHLGGMGVTAPNPNQETTPNPEDRLK